jgi:hypothetical protein
LAAAETAVRESLSIRRRRFGNSHPDSVNSLDLLIDLLRAQNKQADLETSLREALILVRNQAADDPARETSNFGVLLHHLADVLRERTVFAEARSLAEEAVAMYRRHPDWPPNERNHAFVVLGDVLKDLRDLPGLETVLAEQLQALRPQLGSDTPELAAVIAQLTTTLLEEKQFARAEPLARECLAIREVKLPGDWRAFNARSMLGGALLGQEKHAQAEPLLLSGYEGMKEREATIPDMGKLRLKEALQRILQLYEATNRPDKAAEWKHKLELFNREETEKKSAN